MFSWKVRRLFKTFEINPEVTIKKENRRGKKLGTQNNMESAIKEAKKVQIQKREDNNEQMSF